jgi:hypothetical protein
MIAVVSAASAQRYSSLVRIAHPGVPWSKQDKNFPQPDRRYRCHYERNERRRHSPDQARYRDERAAPGQEGKSGEHEHSEAGERLDQPRGVADHHTEQREVRRVALRVQGGEVPLAEGADQGEHVRTVVLHTRRVEVGDRVARVVVVGSPVDEGEVEADKAFLFQHREVRVLRREPVELRHRRLADRIGRGGRELPDQGRVSPRGLEQDRRAGVAGGLPVEHHATVVAVGMLLDERRGAEQPRLLPVGQEEHDIVTQLLTTAQGARRIQDGRDRGLVVCRARGAEGRVVVRGEEHPAGRVLTTNRGDDVLHPSGIGVGAGSGVDAEALLHLYVEPQGG